MKGHEISQSSDDEGRKRDEVLTRYSSVLVSRSPFARDSSFRQLLSSEQLRILAISTRECSRAASIIRGIPCRLIGHKNEGGLN